MNETDTPRNSKEATIIKSGQDPILTPKSAFESGLGIEVPEIIETGSEIQHVKPFSAEEVALKSLRNKPHEHEATHIPVLAEDDTQEIPVVIEAQPDTSVANPRRVSFLHPSVPDDSRQIPKNYQ